MKRVALAIAMAVLVLFAGCKKDKETTGTTLKASIEQYKSGDSKTSIDPSNGAIKWTTGDKIVVNNGTTSGTFTLTNGAGSTTGTFTYNGEYTLGDNNIAVYPETATISGSTVTVTLPAEQDYVAESNGSTPMLGTFTNPDDLTFTSLCGALGISLKAASADVAITAIEVVSKTDEKLNGTFTANASDANPVLVHSTGGTNSVKFNCNITLTNAEAQNFYFAMPVGALANGFILNVYGDGADPIFSTDTDNNIAIVLNQVNQMPEVSVALAPPFDPLLTTPLTLEALSDGYIRVNMNGTLSTGMKYSKNNGAKTLITTTTTIDVNVGDKVQFYGNGTSTSAYGDSPEVGLLGSAQTKVYGNIMSLIDEDSYASCTTLPNKNYVFYGLFKGNVNLTDASGLLLPATTAYACYHSMFYGCKNLTAAPSLPATTLAYQCYRSMFDGCTGLQAAPSLPATSLAEKCYYSMFSDCKNLTTAPALPATTLVDGCYLYMFYYCTSLTTAPALPATTLVSGCYNHMFNNCTSLNSITCLATSGIDSNSSTDNWMMNVASSGTFTKAAGASWPTGNNGIPNGWSVVSQ